MSDLRATTLARTANEVGQSWSKDRLSMDPSYYAGILPDPCRLGSEVLERLYKGIFHTLGEPEAANFVRFVSNLEDLSPSAFIIAFRKFWASECRLVEVEQSCEDWMDDGGTEIGFIAVAGTALFDRPTKEGIVESSESVKRWFLEDHAAEL